MADGAEADSIRHPFALLNKVNYQNENKYHWSNYVAINMLLPDNNIDLCQSRESTSMRSEIVIYWQREDFPASGWFAGRQIDWPLLNQLQGVRVAERTPPPIDDTRVLDFLMVANAQHDK